VEPDFAKLGDGVDPIDYIEQVQAERRDLKTGQKAMWYAFGHRERERANESGAKGGRGKRGSEPNAFKVARTRISEARKILDHSEALGQDVLADRAANVQGALIVLAPTNVAAILRSHRPRRSSTSRLCPPDRSVRLGAYEAWRPRLPCRSRPGEPRHRRR
jgi:hypothetical protein